MTIANTFAAKAGVAFVAIAMALMAIAPAQAATMTAEGLQAQIDALMAQIATLTSTTAPVSTSAYTFTRSLTIGSTGADVTALQTYLIAGGYAIPAGATGYFGAQTASAVAAWQTANGVMPAAGYFGPVSQAKYMALMAAVVPTPSDDSSDDSSDDDSSTDLGDGEGTIDSVTETSGDESNLEEGMEGGVLGFEVEIDGDVEITRMDVFAEVANSATSSDNADDYFTTASLWLDGEKVGEVDVADFGDDDYTGNVSNSGSDDTEYRIRFSDLNLAFADGDQPEFQVAFEVEGSLDSDDLAADWVVALDEIRYVDGEGFNDTDTTVVEDSFGFDAEEMAELTITKNTNSADGTTLEVDTDDESDEQDIFTFDIEEENGVDVTVEDLRVTISTGLVTGTTDEALVVESAILYDGDEELASESVSTGGVVTFENLGLEIEADETAELSLKLTFKGTDDYTEGTDVSVAFTSILDAEDANGNDEGDMTISGTPSSESFTLRSEGLSLDFDSSTFSETLNNEASTTDDQGVFTYKFTVTAFGDDFFFNKTASRGTTGTTTGAEYIITTDGGNSTVTTGSVTQSLTSTADTESGDYKVAEGETETFTLKVTFDPAGAGGAFFGVQLGGVNYTATAGGTTFSAQNVSVVSDFQIEEDAI